MNSTKGAEEIAQGRPQAFKGIEMPLPNAIALLVTRPFFRPVTAGAVRTRQAGVAVPLIPGASRAAASEGFHVAVHDLFRSLFDHAQATLPAPPPNRPDPGGPVIVVGAVAALLIGATPGRVVLVGVFVPFFPPRAETSHRFQVADLSRGSHPTAHTPWLGAPSARYVRSAARAPLLRLTLVHSRLCTPRALIRRLAGDANYCRKRGSHDRD